MNVIVSFPFFGPSPGALPVLNYFELKPPLTLTQRLPSSHWMPESMDQKPCSWLAILQVLHTTWGRPKAFSSLQKRRF